MSVAGGNLSRGIVVVAHADDETLWCGGYLIEHPTDVLCCSIPKDTQRAIDFFEACEVLGVNGYICGKNEKYQDVHAAKVFAASYDHIITHNHIGEYGHKFHIKVHRAMKELGLPMQVFNYGLQDGEPIDWTRKLKALSCYTTRPDVLRNQSKRFILSRECLIPL